MDLFQFVVNSGLNQGHPVETGGPTGVQVPRWKRVLDICLIVMSFPVWFPLMLMVGAYIGLVSPGPILFKQERVGFLGRRFMCFKFRSMVVGADSSVHQGHLHRLMSSNEPMVKMDAHGDPRVIFLGSLLRSSGLDELPQLFNVLRGEMSLVGPRPCLPYEFEKYLPWQRERFDTLPGLTGHWQVSGKNRTTFVEMIRLDIDYVRTKTLWMDVNIIVKTIPALLVQMAESRRKRKSSAAAAQADLAARALSVTRQPVTGNDSRTVPNANRDV